MGDKNPIHALGDYSKPSHEKYRNTIELPIGNNVVSLRSDTIRLVQNGCSFHGLRSEDPNRHLKDFLKLVDSLDLDGKNRERTRLRLFRFSLRDQASNWLERLLAGSITTWEDLTTRFLAQFFPPGWTTKLRNDILIGPYDTQYCMEDFEQAFVEYASLGTDEAGEGMVSEFMASQDARLSKFEANFNQQRSEMTNKIDTVLKTIIDRIAGTLPSDTVKNPKLSATPVFSARSYLTIDHQCSSHPSNLINAIKVHFKEATISQTSLLQPKIETEPPQPEEPKPTVEDEFQDLHLNLLVLEVLAHAPIYNAILDKNVKSLELGKNGSAFVQGEIHVKMEDPGLFTIPCRLGDSKPFDTLADLGSCDDKNSRGITRSVFGVKGVDLGEEEAPYWTTLRKRESYKPRPSSNRVGAQTLYYARKDFLDCHLPEEWEISRDAELNPFKDTLVFRRMLYLMRRSLEVLRKFHWMILGGQFNQLSHVSSPLLSKPGEY
ncbi:MAK10-like protein [Tanacetum coccineum]|uniref:MAK10-like protein n=1 Tax=Tanacetum coccineum TaxID=301880 RepID=A0ABQ4Y8A5_9ASTR